VSDRPAGISLTVKLPALIGVLLALAIAVYVYLADGTVRRSTLAAATLRLTSVTDQLAGSLRQSGSRLIASARQAADTAPVARYLAHPAAGARGAVAALLRPPGAAGRQIAAAEVFDARRATLLAVGDSGVRSATAAATSELLAALTSRDSGLVGRFLVVGDSVVYPVVAPRVSGGRILGYVAVWRYLSTTPESRRQTNQLIGAGARLYLGDASDNVWTDLDRPVAPPPVALTGSGGVLHYVRAGQDGGAMMAVARPVAGTPWLVLIEFPVATVLAPVDAFFRQSVIDGALILVLGVLIAWAASRRVTAPLARLTRTAEDLTGRTGGEEAEPGQGDEIGRLAAAFDSMVRHLREAQQALERRVESRTRELEDRNEELESFAYSISHDLRAPLRAMDGFSQILLEDYGERLDPTGRQYAERIQAAARRMDLLIRDLLAYSRMTRAEIRVAPVPLDHVIRNAVAQVEDDARDRGARIRVDDGLPSVLAHEPTLTQVVMNLVSNGLKFVPAERAPELRVRTEPRDGMVRIWIIDNGIGIAPEYHDRIFRVFERLHRQDEFPGTGIGLAIVRKGMERMGGAVGLDSEPGRGSSFWLELPAAEPAQR